MASDDKKPSLAVVIAQSKKAPGGDDGASKSDYGEDAPSPELVDCLRKMSEASADGDFEGAAKAFEAAMGHARPPAEEEASEGE